MAKGHSNDERRGDRRRGPARTARLVANAGTKMDFEPGQQIGGLRIRRELGRGAYGVVYLAEDSLLGREVALKVLPGPAGGEVVPPQLRDEALNEARLIANLKSSSIVTLYRLRSAEDGGWMMEMELVGGGSLEEELTEGEPLPLPRAMAILRGICLALKSAHAARVIHGDIKPANVMFDEEGSVKLADFGLARIIESGQGTIDLEGQALGTPAYMAPEVLTGQETGIPADLWAVGVLAHQLLSGQLPFAATNMVELWNAVMEGDPQSLPDEVPEPLAALVRSCLARDAADRPATAAAVLEELDRLALIDRRLAPGETLRERPTNVADDPSSFVGRERELADLRALLTDEETRLVTLAGPGGMGKTRTSRQLCRDLLDHFEGGCWFADLSEARTEHAVAQAVAKALGVTLSGEAPPAESVAGVLRYRKPMLLVLDNFEQITAAAPATVGAWREQAPDVRFLVTSRATLGLGGERPYELPPLPTPEEDVGPEAALASDGVRLFLDRAPNLDPTDDDLLAIARISRELDGIPLAIELAAARATILKPRQIADKLTQRFQLLRTSRTDVTARQKTLHGAIEWSFNLLDDAERSAFLQASVFRGGFFLDAAEAILDLDEFPDAPFAMDLVQSLRDKSLLHAYDAGLDTCLDTYRSIRDYARTKWLALATEEQQQALLDRHAAHYLEVADEWNGRLLGARGQEALDRLELELGNLRAVQEQGDASTAAQVALAVAEMMSIRRAPREAIPVIERGLDGLDVADPRIARLKVHLSEACMEAGDWDRALALAREAGDGSAASLQLGELLRGRGDLAAAEAAYLACESSSDERIRLGAIGGRGNVLASRGDLEAAAACWEQAAAIANRIGDQRSVIRFTSNRATYLAESKGDFKGALACSRRAEDLARRLGDGHWIAFGLWNRANLLLQRGEAEAALACYAEADVIARDRGESARISDIASCRGIVHAMRGELDEALACYQEAEEIARQLGDRARIAQLVKQRGSLHMRRHELGPATSCYEQAERLGDEIGDRRLVAICRCHRGIALYSAARPNDAIEALRQGLGIYGEIQAHRSVEFFQFQMHLARYVAEQGDAAEAGTIAREALALAASLGVTEERSSPTIREGLKDLRALASAP